MKLTEPNSLRVQIQTRSTTVSKCISIYLEKRLKFQFAFRSHNMPFPNSACLPMIWPNFFKKVKRLLNQFYLWGKQLTSILRSQMCWTILKLKNLSRSHFSRNSKICSNHNPKVKLVKSKKQLFINFAKLQRSTNSKTTSILVQTNKRLNCRLSSMQSYSIIQKSCPSYKQVIWCVLFPLLANNAAKVNSCTS